MKLKTNEQTSVPPRPTELPCGDEPEDYVDDDLTDAVASEVVAVWIPEWQEEYNTQIRKWREDCAEVTAKSAVVSVTLSKPILTLSEAAMLLDVTTKRLKNILYEEKARTGSLPPFVCDAGGVINRKIDREALIEWVRRRKRRVGRPHKNEGVTR